MNEESTSTVVVGDEESRSFIKKIRHLKTNAAIRGKKESSGSNKSEGNNLFSSKKPYIIFGLLIIVILGCVLVLHNRGKESPNTIPKNNIVIANTTITPQDIKTLSNQLSAYSKQLRFSLGGSPVQVAENDLILNAALKDQARKHNITVTQADINSAIPQQNQPNGSPTPYSKYLESSGLALMTQILNENSVYESKLDNIVIAKKNLFVVGINYDAPYFNNSSDPANLRSQATNILVTKFLPLFKKGESQSQIAAQATINDTVPDHVVTNPQIFFTGMPSYAYDYHNCAADSPCFNDAEVGSFANIPGIVSTETEINQLTKVGQYTKVFTSKAGFIGIIQLTGQTSGAYSSWSQLTQAYKKQYAPELAIEIERTHANFFVATAQSAIHNVAKLDDAVGSLVLPVKASAAPVCSGCSCHDVTINFKAYFYNTQTGVTTPASGAWLQESRGDSACPTSGGYYVDDSGQSGHRPNRLTTDGSGSASALDNCYTPVPYLLQRAPPTPAGFNSESFKSATASSGGTSFSVYNETDFGNQFGPAGEANPGSDISQLWSNGIINTNGGMTVSITYNITPNNTGGGASVSPQCSSLSVTDPGGYKVGSTTYKTNTLVNSGNATPSINASNPSNDGAVWNGAAGSVSGIVSNGRTNNFNYLPTGSNSVTIESRIIYYDSGAGHWYLEPGTDHTTTVSPCYSAQCEIYNVAGNLPGGYASPGGTVTAYALVWNDSSLPEHSGDPGTGAPLQLQTSGGNFSGFSTPVGGGSGLSPYGSGSGWYQYVSFTTTAPSSGSSGTIVAQMAYAGEFSMGNSCSYSVNLWQPPLVNIDNALCGSSAPTLNGWAFAQNGLQAESIDVSVYVDGPMGSGAYLGTVQANIPRPDVDAAYGIPGNHGFSIAIPASYQDGNNHTFYAYALDGVEDGGPATYTMTGCEEFHITPAVGGAALLKQNPNPPGGYEQTDEDPNFFGSATNDLSITVTYDGHSFYGPNSGYSPGFPGVPVSSGYPTYRYTKNGAVVGGGQIPSPNGNGRFIDQNWQAPLLPIVVGTTSAGDVYCLNDGVIPTDGFIQNDGTILSESGGPDTQQICQTVENDPFFKVQNGGVEAGGNYPSSGSCTGGGTLGSWNNDSGLYPDFGAGSQLHALALGNLVGFSSDNNSPEKLNFSNTTNITATGAGGSAYSQYMGGQFGGTHCITTLAPGSGAGTTTLSGNQTIGPMTLNPGPGANRTIYVNGGNVYIAGNITYNTAGWSINSGPSFSTNIPSFTLIVNGGNIYIDPGVSELDGIYTAQTSGASGGTIYTCGIGTTAPYTQRYSIAMNGNNLYQYCDSRLTVNGTFIAKQIDLQRTYGSLRDEQSPTSCSGFVPGPPIGNTCAAEVFNLSPELYLSSPDLAPPSGGAQGYDAETSLPPVL